MSLKHTTIISSKRLSEGLDFDTLDPIAVGNEVVPYSYNIKLFGKCQKKEK